MKTKKIEIVKDRWSDGVVLEISHNGWQTTCINDLDLEDLKKLRRVIRKAITRIINTHGKPRFGNYKFKDIYPSVIKDYQNGMKVKDICDKYSIGHTTLNNYLRRFNIPRHT